jgi:hypothetical protein
MDALTCPRKRHFFGKSAVTIMRTLQVSGPPLGVVTHGFSKKIENHIHAVALH